MHDTRMIIGFMSGLYFQTYGLEKTEIQKSNPHRIQEEHAYGILHRKPIQVRMARYGIICNHVPVIRPIHFIVRVDIVTSECAYDFTGHGRQDEKGEEEKHIHAGGIQSPVLQHTGSFVLQAEENRHIRHKNYQRDNDGSNSHCDEFIDVVNLTVTS